MAIGIRGDIISLPNFKVAKWWYGIDDGVVKCILCPQGCELRDGERGKCLVRRNMGGVLRATSYGKVSAVHIDPIEKKPLFHFFPTKKILSIGGVGCNMSCLFCQNWELVEGFVPVEDIPPEKICEIAEETRKYGNIGIAFTYNEPTIWFEYIVDIGEIVKRDYPHLKLVLVSNGYISYKPLLEILEYVSAMNIDLKFSTDEDYKRISDAHLKPVLKTIRSANCHIEVTNLVITGINDKDDDFERVSDFVAEIDPSIPFHISRYFPHFKMSNPPTPIERLMRAYEIAKKKLKYVYVGNLSGNDYENTYCPKCGETLIRRFHFETELLINSPFCPKCGEKIKIVF